MNVKVFIVSMCLGIVVGIASYGSYEDDLQDEKNYCEMVNEGTWPNYKGLNCDNINK